MVLLHLLRSELAPLLHFRPDQLLEVHQAYPDLRLVDQAVRLKEVAVVVKARVVENSQLVVWVLVQEELVLEVVVVDPLNRVQEPVP